MRTEPDEAVRHSGPLQMRRQGRYEIEGVAGKGTFGVVYFGQDRKTGERIAIKKVLQDKKYKNR